MKRRFSTFLLLFLLMAGQTCTTSEAPAVSPANLTHALALVDSLKIDNETLAFIWIYADAPSYRPVEARGEGVACVDDAGRFMEVLETEILDYRNADLLPLARGITKFLLYMSRTDGLWHNFMYRDGSINTDHQNSTADFGWWAVRGIRGLTAAYRIFESRPADALLLQQIVARLAACETHWNAALARYPETRPSPLGEHPAWLTKDAPDLNAELLGALCRLQASGRFDYRDAIRRLADGLCAYQFIREGHPLNGMYICWQNSWHNWGNTQAFALMRAFDATGDSSYFKSVVRWADNFVPFLIENNYPHDISIASDGQYEIRQFPQIAYGMNSIYQGINALAESCPDPKYIQFSEQVFGWFTDSNVAGSPMYEKESGRGFDGIEPDSSINRSSGAESTIEALLAVQKHG